MIVIPILLIYTANLSVYIGDGDTYVRTAYL